MLATDWPKVGQYVDFKDRDHLWQVGLVIFKNEHCLKIRNEGWCQRYDEIIPIGDQANLLKNTRIQPFRSLIRGYTGQRKTPSVREHWKFTRADHQIRLKKLEDFISTLSSRTPEQLIQYLRGEHYFYIDFLMSNTYLQLEDVRLVYDYFLKHIAFLYDFIRRLLQKGIQFSFINQRHPEGQQDIWDKTYDNCYYELIEALYNIAGLQDRLSVFARSNEAHVKEIVGVYEKHEYYISTQIQTTKLYDSIIELITHTHHAIQHPNKQIKLPFAFAFSLYQLFQIIQTVFHLQNLKQQGAAIFQMLFEIIRQCVEEIEPNDMKQGQIERELEYILIYMRSTATKYKKQYRLVSWPEHTRMRICMLLLRCDKLEKKIKGISKIKEIAEKIIREEYFDFSQEAFIDIIHSLKFFEELFVQNEHLELFKKSIEFVCILYKFDMITANEICYVWKASIHKHPMIVTILLQFWIEMAYIIQIEDLKKYVKVVIGYYLQTKTENGQFLQFFLDLALAIISNNIKTTDNKKYEEQNQQINQVIEEMAKIGYQMLIKSVQQPFFHSLVIKYGSVVLQSAHCQQLIHHAYSQLRTQDHFSVCLQILNEIYVNHDRFDIFVPEDINSIFIGCLSKPNIKISDVGYILNIINSIITYSTKYVLKQQELHQLWTYFQSNTQQFKNYFYDWILPLRSEEIHDNITSHINMGFNSDLKKFLLNDILSNQQNISYSRLTKKELSIILQLFIEVNVNEGKIQRKKILEGYRFIHRAKAVQLSNEQLLWQIFQKCKQQEVIQYLNRYLIKFYFFLSPSLPLNLKKSRIDSIMTKIITQIQEAYSKGNLRLVKCSLWLLKYAFQLVREQDRYYPLSYSSEDVKPYTLKIELRCLNNIFKIEVPENETVPFLKAKVAERMKIKSSEFKLLVKEENHIEELDFSYRTFPVNALRKSIIDIVLLSKEEETIPKFMAHFISLEIENLFIQMLENQSIATDVFMVLQEMDLKMDKSTILKQINQILEKYEKASKTTLSVQIYYHLLQLKIFAKMLQKDEEALAFTSTKSFERMLTCMQYPIYQQQQMTFIYKIICLFSKILKKSYKHPTLPTYIFNTILRVSDYQLNNSQLDHNIRAMAARIVQSSNYIIQNMLGEQNMIKFYVSQPSFAVLVQKLYMHPQLQEIRMLFTDRLGIYLSRIAQSCFQQNIENYFLQLFVDHLYFKVQNQELANSSNHMENDAVIEFFQILGAIISNVSQHRFENSQIMKPIKGKSQSLYEHSISFIESLKLFNTADFHWNSLLNGHFCILSNIYKQKPTLIDADIITFVLENCLALTQKLVAEPLCKKKDQIKWAFEFFYSILSINTELKHIKLVMDLLQPCHKSQIWRNSLNWNVTPKQEPKQSYRGLINPGCICYLNSLLQQLYMIDDFRLAVLNTDTSSSKMIEEKQIYSEDFDNRAGQEEGDSSSQIVMLQGLKELFLKLQFSQESSINPSSFAKTLKTNDKKQMIKFNEQMDIDQFASILFQRIEKGTRDIGIPDFVKALFGGVFAHQIISKECQHTSEREEQFISISLQVKENILKSFQSLVKSQLLDGSNKYHCQKCDKKVKAEKLQTIKQLPPFLMLCLKRFEFDYDIDAKIKINDYCQFPQHLNLSQFSQQEIVSMEEDLSSEDEREAKHPPEYFKYQLRGVVVHTGSADSGHYYSFIDNRKGAWFQFNDEEVLSFNIQKLPEQAFGCRSTRYDLKTKNAYLLFYERVGNKGRKDQYLEGYIMEKSQNKGLIQSILKKNREIRKFEIVFSQEYESLVSRLQNNRCIIEKRQKNWESRSAWVQFQLSFYFLIKIRKENNQYFIVFSKNIENYIKEDISLALFFLTHFYSPKFIEEFFVFNPAREKCKVVAHLLSTALERHYNVTKVIPFQKNYPLLKMFKCFRAIFILHSLVPELLTVVRKFLDLALRENDFKTLYGMIRQFNFQQIIFNFALAKPFDKKIKIEIEQYYKDKSLEIAYLAPFANLGKKQFQPCFSETWKIMTVLLRLVNKYINDPENQLKQQRDYYLNIINYMKESLKEPNLQAKIINLISDSSTNKASYYLYFTLKQLSFHANVLPFIEKAFKDFKAIKFRPFFLYLENAVNDKDADCISKETLFGLIERAYKTNEKYFLEFDIIHQWILRLVSVNEQFLQVVESNRQLLQDIITKLTKNPSPSVIDLAKQLKHQVIERILNRSLGILVSTDNKDYEKNSMRMKQIFQKIFNYTYNPEREFYPPEDSYLQNQAVEYFDINTSKWKQAYVLENNFGQLTLAREGKKEIQMYLWEDSDKLRRVSVNKKMQIEASPPVDSDISGSSGSYASADG